MTTIADKLSAIKNCKTDIASAIEAKGVSVAGASFSDYASLIGQIASSAGSDRIFQCPIASRDAIDLAAALPFPLIIDGHTFSDQESVLLLGQPTGNNGLYQYTIDGESGSLIRLEDDIQNRNLVFITSGSFIRHVFSNAADVDTYVDVSLACVNITVSPDAANELVKKENGLYSTTPVSRQAGNVIEYKDDGLCAIAAGVDHTHTLSHITDLSVATTGNTGLVKVDGSTITVDSDGTIHATGTGGNADIPVFDGTQAGLIPKGDANPLREREKAFLNSYGKWCYFTDDNLYPNYDEDPFYVRYHYAEDSRECYIEFGLAYATYAGLGVVRPDNTTITVDGLGVISAVIPEPDLTGYATKEWCANSFEQFATKDYVDGYGFLISSDVTDVVAQTLPAPISSKGVYAALAGKADTSHTHTGEEVQTALGYAPVKPPAFVDTRSYQPVVLDQGIELPDDEYIEVEPPEGGYSLTLAVEENTVYSCGELSDLTLSSLPDSHLESLIYFSTGMFFNQIAITGKYKTIGELTVKPEKSYVLSILDKVLVLGEITEAGA